MAVSLIIPALNEAECLIAVLGQVPTGCIDELIVVDNGSTDQTSQVARRAGALVFHEPRRGYGFACAAGAAQAAGDVLAFMDGDGSFDPAELPALLGPLESLSADLVLGSRRTRAGRSGVMPPHQLLGNRIFAWLLRQRYGLALTDLGPFRAIRRSLLDELDMRERTYGWPLEMIIKAARRGSTIVEVPITYTARRAGQSKVGGTLRGSLLTGCRFASVMLRYAY